VNVGRKPNIRQFKSSLALPDRSQSKMYVRRTDRFEGATIQTLEREGRVGPLAFRLVSTGTRS
jgi:hypothetical protein